MLQIEIVWQVDCKAYWIFLGFWWLHWQLGILAYFVHIQVNLFVVNNSQLLCWNFFHLLHICWLCSIVWNWLSMVCCSGSRTATLYAGASGKSERRKLQEWSTFLWVFIHGGTVIFFYPYVNFSNVTSNVILYCCLYRDVH